MKKPILLLALFMISQLFKAQVPNYSFENLNPDGTIKNWGALILIAVVLDSTGHPTDSLIVDNGFYFSTNNAHTGTKALEMRNAYWQGSGETISGRAWLSAEEADYNTFITPVPVGQSPIDFSFYYKFIPANGDTAYASLTLTDSMANVVGEAKIFIQGAHSLYTFTSTPVIYTGTTPAAFMEIWFSTSKPYSQASYGTRFVVDDVNISGPTTGISPLRLENNSISTYPNPAKKEVNLQLKKPAGDGQLHLQLINSEGKQIKDLSYFTEGNLVKINTQELAEGLYFVNVIHGGYTYTAKFIK